MDGFDTSTMTYMAPPLLPGNPMNENEVMYQGIHMPQTHELYSNFGASTYAASDDFGFQGIQPMAAPALTRMQTALDEVAYSDIATVVFDTQNGRDLQDGGTETTIDRDHKLLSFSAPTYDMLLLDYSFNQTSVVIAAQLHGMFFLTESPWAAEAPTPQQELTCYRRNLFQIMGNITASKMLQYIMNEDGTHIPILSLELIVSGVESTEGSSVKIISVPWKTPPNPAQAVPEDKTEKEPSPTPIDLAGIHDTDPEFVECPISYQRLQFRSATANNGRRKELQQHFVVRLQVVATLATGARQCICEVRSNPIVVRGRSPRNFSTRKDTPLIGTANHTRKSASAVPQVPRMLTGDTATRPSTSVPQPTSSARPPPASSTHCFFDPNDFTASQDLHNDLVPTPVNAQPIITAVAPLTPAKIPQELFSSSRHQAHAASSPEFGRPAAPAPILTTARPHISLSLMDEPEAPPGIRPPPPPPPLSTNPRPTPPRTMTRESSSATTPHNKKLKQTNTMPPPRPATFSLNTASTPPDGESADLLYEYFPLSLDDWMPPVDAVYRPHVVHHIRVGAADPRDPNSVAPLGRSKRYFSETVV